MTFSRFFRHETRLLPASDNPVCLPVVTLLMFAPLVVGLIGIAMGQSLIWDLRNYHWYNAYAFLTGRYAGGIDIQPSQLQFFHNPLMDLPFYFLATHFTPRAAYFALGCVQGLNFPLLFMLAHAVLDIGNPKRKAVICLLLAALGMAGGMGIAEFGVPFYDNVASLGVLGSAVLVVANLGEMTKAPWRRVLWLAFLAGAPVGLATGLKMTTAVFCVGLCAALPFTLRLSERGILLGFFFGLGILAGAGLVYAHWGWYLYGHFGSPMFPYFNRIFHSPWVAPGYIEDFSAPRGLLVPLLFPLLFANHTTLVNEIPFRDLRIPIAYVLMAVVGLLSLWRLRPGARQEAAPAAPLPSTYLLWASAVSYLVWISVEAYYRYLLPLEMLAPLVIVLCVERLPLTARVRTGVIICLMLVIVTTLKVAPWERRHEWAQHIAQIERPALPDSSDIMILMAMDDGYSYLIPEFPPSIPFVRLESRAFRVDSGWAFNDLIRARIEAHKGSLKLLVPAREVQRAENRPLKYYGLKVVSGSCKDVVDDIAENDLDPLYPKYYKLCDVVKAKQRPG